MVKLPRPSGSGMAQATRGAEVERGGQALGRRCDVQGDCSLRSLLSGVM